MLGCNAVSTVFQLHSTCVIRLYCILVSIILNSRLFSLWAVCLYKWPNCKKRLSGPELQHVYPWILRRIVYLWALCAVPKASFTYTSPSLERDALNFSTSSAEALTCKIKQLHHCKLLRNNTYFIMTLRSVFIYFTNFIQITPNKGIHFY